MPSTQEEQALQQRAAGVQCRLEVWARSKPQGSIPGGVLQPLNTGRHSHFIIGTTDGDSNCVDVMHSSKGEGKSIFNLKEVGHRCVRRHYIGECMALITRGGGPGDVSCG